MTTQSVKINSGLFYSNEITGTFPLVKAYIASINSKREGFVWVEQNSKTVKLHCNAADVTVVGSTDDRSDADISTEIESRFIVMETLVDGIIDRNIKSMILTGAPGIGKSFTVDEKLQAAERAGKCKVSQLTGSCTPIGLYMQLWNHQNEGDVLILDDIDSIFGDIESLNLLKGALDTGRTRQISWMSASKYLQENDIDNTFEFKGTVLFISNMNFDKMIEKASKMSPHFAALINRCVYLDLGIHTTREIMIRINQVVRNTSILRDLGISQDHADEIMNWMIENQDNLRSLSIRTILQLASFIKTSEANWKMIAEATMIKR